MRAATLAIAAVLVSGCGDSNDAETAGRAPTPPEEPNILVLVTDDQRDRQMRFMPATRRLLGARGTTFTQAYVTTPLCCPSRGSIFSGKYAHNHGIIGADVAETVREYDLQETWPAILQRRGYRTGLSGKFLNSWPREERPEIMDFYRWADRANASDANARVDDLRVDDALEFLRSTEEDDERSWALTVAFHSPHVVYNPPARYRDYDTGPYPQSEATFSRRSVAGKAQAVRDEQASERFVERSWEGQGRELRATDDLIRKLMDELESAGELDDTLIIFLSDNGYMTGEHGLTKKAWPYLPSIHVPMIVRPPGGERAGARSDDLVANIDLAPTIFEAAGVEPDYTVDGRSLLSAAPREWLFLEGPRLSPRSPYKPWDAYIDHETHFIQWRDEGEWQELYDLRRDPFEVENLMASDDPQAGAPYLELIDEAAGCAGSECP